MFGRYLDPGGFPLAISLFILVEEKMIPALRFASATMIESDVR